MTLDDVTEYRIPEALWRCLSCGDLVDLDGGEVCACGTEEAC